MGGYGLDRCAMGCCDQGNVHTGDQQSTQSLHVTAAALIFWRVLNHYCTIFGETKMIILDFLHHYTKWFALHLLAFVFNLRKHWGTFGFDVMWGTSGLTEELYTRLPFVTCISRRARSGRRISFGRRVWLIESRTVLVICVLFFDLFINLFWI